MGSLSDYRERIVPAWREESKLSSPLAVPRLVKIVLNMGLKEGVNDRKVPAAVLDELTLIAGQKAVITYARKSEAGFKLRAGMAIGLKATLRRRRMYDFFDRLVGIALPRVRDFRGLPANSFDGHGNYSLGLTEQIVFPEINIEKIQRVRGLDITLVTNARDDENARRLLAELGLPIR